MRTMVKVLLSEKRGWYTTFIAYQPLGLYALSIKARNLKRLFHIVLVSLNHSPEEALSQNTSRLETKRELLKAISSVSIVVPR